MPVTTDFAGTETLAETKSRLGALLTAYGYDSSGYSTWGDARADLNSALTAIEETTISDGELASSFRSKLNALNAWSDYPAGGKVPNLVFDFEGEYYRANDTETTFGDSITFSRASSATYVDSDGVLQTAASGVPRIGHHVWNGSAWVNEGLLHESEARTNLLLYSETLDGTGWSDSSSISTNLTDGALGVWDGVSIASGGALFNRLCAIDDSSVTSGDVLTVRVWAKAGTSGEIRINLRDITSGNSSNLRGAFGSIAAIADDAGTITSVKEEDWGNGIVAISGTITVNFTGDLEFGIGPNSEVAGETVIAYAAQIEEGSTPSSYIPTSGSTVTRTAETLTIPAAKLPWPTPNVIGPELVTNGTFDTDISGWSEGGGANLSWSSGTLVVTNDPSDNFAGAYQTITTEAGSVYQVTYDIVSADGGTELNINDGASAGNGILDTGSFLGTGGQSFFFVAQSTQTTIYFLNRVGGGSASFDNISVREIDPLSVSIQMDGRMTYADTDEVTAVNQVRWQADASNRIYQFVTTSGGATGKFGVQQISGGVADSSQETGNTLVPGILTPFNTAGRHGSTFIRGAIDGTLMPANTTPTALPDLSTTDLELGYDYMGTIRTFRMWDQDITDAGIEEASA